MLKIFRRFLLLLLITININFLPAQKAIGKKRSSYSRLLDLLHEKNFFRLSGELLQNKERLSPEQRLYLQAYIDNAFNKNEEAIRHTNMLINSASFSLPDSARAALHLLRSESYFKLYRYAKAAQEDSIVLQQFAGALDSGKIDEVSNELIIYNGLRELPPQRTSIRGGAVLSWKRNKLGIVEIPVKINGRRFDAVFDTRANLSTITQTYARELRLRLLPVSYYEGSGITGIRFQTGLAIADSLWLGSILVQHAVFQVVPDSILFIAPVDFQINIIVGYPIIEQLNEVHFYKNGRLEIPASASKSELRNMALDGLNPVIALKTSSGEVLPFAFDFGASRSILFAAYFNRYRQSVLSHGTRTSSEYGGAGGTQKKEVVRLPSVDLFLGNKKVTLDSVDVLSAKVYPAETFYGNIGQDFVSRFQQLILNFRAMYIKGL